MDKHYVANNVQEARVIVNLMQSHPSIESGWHEKWYLGSYPVTIRIGEDAWPSTCLLNKIKGSTAGTIMDLLKLALNDWVEPRWKPVGGDTYYVPKIAKLKTGSYLEYKHTDDDYDDEQIETGFACRTREEALARSRHMMQANIEFVWKG